MANDIGLIRFFWTSIYMYILKMAVILCLCLSYVFFKYHLRFLVKPIQEYVYIFSELTSKCKASTNCCHVKINKHKHRHNLGRKVLENEQTQNYIVYFYMCGKNYIQYNKYMFSKYFMQK